MSARDPVRLSPPTASFRDASIFRFDALPIELRYAIYELITGDEKIIVMSKPRKRLPGARSHDLADYMVSRPKPLNREYLHVLVNQRLSLSRHNLTALPILHVRILNYTFTHFSRVISMLHARGLLGVYTDTQCKSPSSTLSMARALNFRGEAFFVADLLFTKDFPRGGASKLVTWSNVISRAEKLVGGHIRVRYCVETESTGEGLSEYASSLEFDATEKRGVQMSYLMAALRYAFATSQATVRPGTVGGLMVNDEYESDEEDSDYVPSD